MPLPRPTAKWQTFIAVLLFCGATSAQRRSHIGGIDLYGYGGLDTTAVLRKLATFHNRRITPQNGATLRKQVGQSVSSVTGQPPSGMALICCEPGGSTHMFVGLRGSSFREGTYRHDPIGNDTLPANGLELYHRGERAIMAAVRRGNAGEDDSFGYALSIDPAARSVQRETRAYAVHYPAEIRQVLLRSAQTEQRRAAALLLGYAPPRRIEVAALASALQDADAEVRNNATRALGVLANVTPLRDFDAAPVIAMLYSGEWTDRNKAGLLLASITRSRDLRLLDQLRREALPPLLEGARWTSSAHAGFFLLVLGRIAGMNEAALNKAVAQGKVAEVIASLNASP